MPSGNKPFAVHFDYNGGSGSSESDPVLLPPGYRACLLWLPTDFAANTAALIVKPYLNGAYDEVILDSEDPSSDTSFAITVLASSNAHNRLLSFAKWGAIESFTLLATQSDLSTAVAQGATANPGGLVFGGECRRY